MGKLDNRLKRIIMDLLDLAEDTSHNILHVEEIEKAVDILNQLHLWDDID